MTTSLWIICIFTFSIHLTESLAYCMRLSGVRTRQIAIALSFVTVTLLVTRLSNMIQAPFLGILVDTSVAGKVANSVSLLETQFRIVIFAAFIGAFVGMLLSPTASRLFHHAILKFLECGSVPKVLLMAFWPKNMLKIIKLFRWPRLSTVKQFKLTTIPKSFLIFNVIVTAVYTIGVLCSLLAGAYLPELRATAIQLSGIVNGIATILLTLFVDPAGARITDQAMNGQRSEDDVKTVVFYLQLGKVVGTLIIAQLLFKPLTHWVMWVTKQMANVL